MIKERNGDIDITEEDIGDNQDLDEYYNNNINRWWNDSPRSFKRK